MQCSFCTLRRLVALLGLLACCVPAGNALAGNPAGSGIVSYAIDGEFDAVRDNLRLAITNQGLVINSESDIGGMLERTGTDLGKDTRLYEHAVAFEFCSASFSRRMMEADPLNITFCPFVISVFQLPGETGTVHVAYRPPHRPDAEGATREALDAVANLLDGIAREATW